MTTLETIPTAGILPTSNVSERVRKLMEDSRAENTKRAYRSDWQHFTRWCKRMRLVSLPAEAGTVADYVAELKENYKPATIARKVASISTAHKMAGVQSPCSHPEVALTLEGMRRNLGTAQHKKTPIRVDNLRAAFKNDPSDLADLRNRALILLGYAGGFRRSELVALDRADLQRTPDGYIVTVRRSKTDQEGAGMLKAIPYGSNRNTCPVRALDALLETFTDELTPLFRRIRKGNNPTAERLSDKAVALIVKDIAESLGLDPALVGGHSLRSGFVTDAYASNAPEALIMDQTGHKSHSAMRGYRREANLFKQNAASMVGL